MNIRISLGQAVSSENKEENLKKALKLMKIAYKKKADILILPELFMAYIPLSKPPNFFFSIAESVTGPFISTLSAEAERRKLHLVVGIFEKPEEDQFIYNTAVLIGPNGNLIAKHRKLYLFDSFNYKESERITPGENFKGAFNTDLARMGLMICYEIRFPELARILTLQGAELLLVPSAWVMGRLKEDHLITLAKARALENTIFLAISCQTNKIFTGRSMVIDPFGVVICDAGEEEGVAVTDINLNRITRVREKLSTIKNIRRDILTQIKLS